MYPCNDTPSDYFAEKHKFERIIVSRNNKIDCKAAEEVRITHGNSEENIKVRKGYNERNMLYSTIELLGIEKEPVRLELI